MDDPVFEKIRKEIATTQERRYKIDVIKITFASALLGFGGIKTENIKELYQVLYLAPLVAVFLDLLAMGEHFSIRRMGAFLRLSSSSEKEQQYEDFVRRNLDKFFILGSRGFTVLSFVAAVALLVNVKGTIDIEEIIWFSATFLFFVIIMCLGKKRLNRLNDLTSTSQSIYSLKK